MVKDKRDILEDLWNETLREVVNSEVKIALLKKHKPNEIIYDKIEIKRTFDGKPYPLKKDFTVKMLLEDEEKKWRGNLEVLETIKDLLAREKNETG